MVYGRAYWDDEMRRNECGAGDERRDADEALDESRAPSTTAAHVQTRRL